MSRIVLAALALLAAGPAAAQAPICGGISLVGEWVGGEEAASDVARAETAFEGVGRVPIAGHAVRMFTLSEAATMRIDVRGMPSGDPYVSLFDEAGLTVAEDDDSLGDLGSRIATELEPGTYCLAIRSYDPRGGGRGLRHRAGGCPLRAGLPRRGGRGRGSARAVGRARRARLLRGRHAEPRGRPGTARPSPPAPGPRRARMRSRPTASRSRSRCA